MRGTGTDIANDGGPAWCHLTLDIEVPIHHECAFGVLLNVAIAHHVWVKGNVRVDSTAQRCSSSLTIVADYLVGERSCRVQAKLVGQGQNIEQAESSADRSLAVIKRIPRESDARLEVLGSRVAGDKAAKVNRPAGTARARVDARRGAVRQGCNLLNVVARIDGQRRELIPQTQV